MTTKLTANEYVRADQVKVERFVKSEYWRLRGDGRFAFTRAPLIRGAGVCGLR